MHILQSIWRGLDWSVLTNLLLSVVPALICITLHELAHGYVAYRLGDDTVKRAGRLTLNPLRHIDIMGLLMMIVFKFGWAKPVPVNMWKFKNPKKGMAITAAAGPIANLLIALVFLFLYGFLFALLHRPGRSLNWLLEMLYITAYLSIALAIFNIIPIPPLDGSKVLFSCISDRSYTKLMYYERYGMIILLVLVLLLSRTSLDPLSRAAYWVMDKLFFAANWGFGLAKLFV
ncbi:MAG: site-2 protease family protein [Oscillospiraceae bacterium]|nr:site-2 protease family protein [Oscillospiraceae bacterium]